MVFKSSEELEPRVSQPERETALLLSIRRENAERIFSGEKHYELRKVLPRQLPVLVYLYESGSGGVVGCFDVASVIRQPIDELWKTVGNAATIRRRFYDYFGPFEHGYAIEIKNPLRFGEPVRLSALRAEHPRLTAPQSYLVLTPEHPLYAPLKKARLRARRKAVRHVTLRPIAPTEKEKYKRLVTESIGAFYDEIDASFAEANLFIHDQGFDPVGFFTTRKEVLAIENEQSTCVGFTTLTYKSGGSVKSGPTVLLKKYRRKGYGQATRRAITDRAREANARKIYCTCPDRAAETIEYLLTAGLRIEAHLDRQYTSRHGELVFGQFLVVDEPPSAVSISLPSRPGTIVPPQHFTAENLVPAFHEMFEQTWHPAAPDYVRQIVDQTLDTREGPFAYKPKSLICLADGDQCVGAVVLLPKRGGAVKAVLLRGTSHIESLTGLVRAAVQWATDQARRKIYVLHPLKDDLSVRVLRACAFEPEGLIRAPYAPGTDAIVLTKFI